MESCLVPSASSTPTLGQFAAPTGCFHARPRSICVFSIDGTPPSLPYPLCPPFPSIFHEPGIVFTSKTLAFLSSVLHRYLVSFSIKSSPVTIPFNPEVFSVCLLPHLPPLLPLPRHWNKAGYFLSQPQALVCSFLLPEWVLVLSPMPPLPLQGPSERALPKSDALHTHCNLTQHCFLSGTYKFQLHILVSFEFALYFGSCWERLYCAHSHISSAE